MVSPWSEVLFGSANADEVLMIFVRQKTKLTFSNSGATDADRDR